MRNTLKTLTGYVATLILKYSGIETNRADLGSIFNYVPISDRIGTSGQPTRSQFAAIREQGFETVINLLPADSENSLANEDQIVRDLGMDYIHIPVDFKGPKESDYAAFVDAMQTRADQKIWVHCAVNARVSVFVARYRRDVEGVAADEAHAPIAKVWEPFGVWKQFLKPGDK